MYVVFGSIIDEIEWRVISGNKNNSKSKVDSGLLTDWMPARVAGEHFLEIRTANGQYNFMGMQQFTVTGQCDIHQIAALEQIMETGRYVFLTFFKREKIKSIFVRRFFQDTSCIRLSSVWQ